MTTIGIIGSGHVGGSLARAATAHGYDVVLSNSQRPDTLADLVSELGPRASAATPAEAAAAGDLTASGDLAADPAASGQRVTGGCLDGVVGQQRGDGDLGLGGGRQQRRQPGDG
jgi:3-hydroxyacyl-CoA dehydrogenase